MILNMNQLRAFFVAAKSNSITKAADALMVTPPAITMQIKKLEKAVGVRLLVRDGNSIRLTKTGDSVLTRAEKIFTEIHEMEGFFDDISMSKSGELRIGCPETPLKRLAPLIADFNKTHPGIKIILDQGSNAEMVKSIGEHRNELAVVRCRSNYSRLKTKSIWAEEVLLIAAPLSSHWSGPDISVMQLPVIPLILRREGSAVREIVLEYLRKFKVKPLIAMESGSIVLVKEFVMQDRGLAFMEKGAVEEELKNGSLISVHILEGSPIIEFGIGYRNRRDLSPPAWAFLRLLENSNITLRS